MVVMIILLILCLPLILMLSIFTTTNVVSIVVDVPVTGIEIAVEEVIELDLDKGDTFEVEYDISPSEASKKDVRFLFSKIGDAKLAEFKVEGNKIIPTSYGSALVTLETLDGGYRDSFQVVVYSKIAESISSVAQSDTIKVGEYTKIDTEFYPKVVNDEGLTYRVKEGEGIATVTKDGRVRGIGVGTAVIEVTSTSNPEAKCDVVINVESSGVVDFVNNKAYITALDDVRTGSFGAVINPEITVSGHTIKLLNKDGEEVPASVIEVSFDEATGLLTYNFKDRNYIDTVEIQLTVIPSEGEAVTKSCYVEQISEITIAWIDQDYDGRYDVFNGLTGGNRIGIDLRPLGADVSYRITLDYKKSTDLTNSTHGFEPGVAFDLEEGVRYYANGGYVSIELDNTPEGVFLVVEGEYKPSFDDLQQGLTVTYIKLSVYNNVTNEWTHLDEVSVVVY